MASFKVAREKIEAALKDMLKDEYLRKLGETAAGMIRLRTQLGYGVPKAGSTREKLKPLSPGYKAARKKMELSANTSSTKSNLTRTGQLLSSLGVSKVSNSVVTISPTGSRDDGYTNEQIAEFVTEQGRAFNNLSDVEQKRLREMVRKDLQAQLQKAIAKIK